MDKKDGSKKSSPISEMISKKSKKKRKKSHKKTKEKGSKISSKVKNRKGNTSASATEGEHSVSDNNGGFESDASSIQRLQNNDQVHQSQHSFVLNPLKGQSTSATTLVLSTTLKSPPPMSQTVSPNDVRLCFSNSAKSFSSRTTLCNITESISEISLASSQKIDSKSENESLRWDDKLSDSEAEEERICQYKINRRKRYIEAQNKKAGKKAPRDIKTTSFSSSRTLQPIKCETVIATLVPTVQPRKYKTDNLLVGT